MKPSKTGPFPYVPIHERPILKWPNGARLAFWVIVNIECFALDEQIVPESRHIPNVPAWAARDYGARIGVWRQMEVLQRHGIRATVALNSEVCDMYPQIVDAAVDLGWEFMGHSESNTRRHTGMDPEEERRVIFDTQARIEKATGTKPIGWLGAGRQETWHTLDFLVEAGFQYVADWTNDDQPYLMNVNGKQLVSVPYDGDTGDKGFERTPFYNCTEYEADIRRKFDVLYREGATSGRVMALSLHPYITGAPHRIDVLDSALSYICRHEGVWLATGQEIMKAYLESGATF